MGKHQRAPLLVSLNAWRRAWLVFGLWGIVSSMSNAAPRYVLVVDYLCAAAVITSAVVNSPWHVAFARRLVVGTATALFAIAGVVASASLDEALTLIAGALTVVILSFPLWLPARHKPRHSRPA